MEVNLKYTDTDDRSYGLTGMAIGMVVYDGQEMLAAINLDAEVPSQCVEFSPAFFFKGNPRFSAKLAWNNLLEHYRLTTAMMVSDVLCRTYVKRHKPLNPEQAHALLEAAREDGREVCQLEQDEIDEMFSDTLNSLHNVFSHSGVQQIAEHLASTLQTRRRMIAAEILDELAALRRL